MFCCPKRFFLTSFSHASTADTCWFCMNEAKKSKFRHTQSHLSPFGPCKYFQMDAAPQPPPCLEGILPGAMELASIRGEKTAKCTRNLPDPRRSAFCFICRTGQHSAPLCFPPVAGPSQNKTWLKAHESRHGQTSSTCREEEALN